MIEVGLSNVIVALGVTAAAGLATALGSFLVLFSRAPSPRILSFGLAFAGGAMVYVSLSEILNKSIASFAKAYGDKMGFTFGTLAFLAGLGLIALIDHIAPNPHESLASDAKDYKENDRAHIPQRRQRNRTSD